MPQGYGQGQQQAPQQQGQGVGMQHLLNQMNPNFLKQFAQNFPQGVPPMFQQGVQQPIAAHLAPEFEEEDCIVYPGVDANNFELKTSLIQMVQANQFGGARVEDPKAHVVHFDRICNTIKMNGIPTDAIKLRLFPFSLRDQALSWLNSFSANHLLTWEQLYKAFMQEYCPPSKAAKLKKLIQNFQQFGNENLHEAWKRFKDLRRQCPKNLLTPGDFISSFYEGLLDSSKIIIDTSSYGGIFMDMGPDYGEQLIERITSNTEYWYNERSDPPKREKPAGMFEVDDKMAVQAQLNSIQHMLKQMMQGPKQSVQAVTQPPPQVPYMPTPVLLSSISLQFTGTSNQGSSQSVEQIDMIGYSRPQGQGQGYQSFGQQGINQYGNQWNNQGRNPPPGFQGNQGNRGGNQGIQWRGNQNQNQWNQQGTSQPPQDPDMKSFMTMMMNQMGKLQAEVENLRTQCGGNKQEPPQAPSSSGKLPATTENPRHQVNAVTTRSGLALKDPPYPTDDRTQEGEVEEDVNEQEKGDKEEEIVVESDNEEEPSIQKDKSKGKAPVLEQSA
ncbi:uncharacterized protein LOC115999429 [Ipomoea triloba]|uniref:uncharacterized protein LOC115999429 n=1 Tax=Ipomoea triloba TaxID=35885 RepID=UPI00125D4D15|nr:uncharacterized protein LOC115999429 [Ipomoea triloba]